MSRLTTGDTREGVCVRMDTCKGEYRLQTASQVPWTGYLTALTSARTAFLSALRNQCL